MARHHLRRQPEPRRRIATITEREQRTAGDLRQGEPDSAPQRSPSLTDFLPSSLPPFLPFYLSTFLPFFYFLPSAFCLPALHTHRSEGFPVSVFNASALIGSSFCRCSS